mgnify:FL=1
MEGITARMPRIASTESSRPSERPRNHAGATEPSARVEAPDHVRSKAMAGPQAIDVNLASEIAAELDSALKNLDGDFSVSVDGDSGMIVVRITDEVTGEIVRQVPPQELLDAGSSMEKIVGLLVDDRA